MALAGRSGMDGKAEPFLPLLPYPLAGSFGLIHTMGAEFQELIRRQDPKYKHFSSLYLFSICYYYIGQSRSQSQPQSQQGKGLCKIVNEGSHDKTGAPTAIIYQ